MLPLTTAPRFPGRVPVNPRLIITRNDGVQKVGVAVCRDIFAPSLATQHARISRPLSARPDSRFKWNIPSQDSFLLVRKLSDGCFYMAVLHDQSSHLVNDIVIPAMLKAFWNASCMLSTTVRPSLNRLYTAP